MTPPIELLTYQEAAAYLRISRAHLFKLLKRGLLRRTKISTRKCFIPRAELDRFIERNTRHLR